MTLTNFLLLLILSIFTTYTFMSWKGIDKGPKLTIIIQFIGKPKTNVQGKKIPGNLKKYFMNLIGLRKIDLGGFMAIVPKGFQWPLLSLVPKFSSFKFLTKYNLEFPDQSYLYSFDKLLLFK